MTNTNLSKSDKSSASGGYQPLPDAPRAISVICDLCSEQDFAERSRLIERGWELSQSAFCPVCSRSI